MDNFQINYFNLKKYYQLYTSYINLIKIKRKNIYLIKLVYYKFKFF